MTEEIDITLLKESIHTLEIAILDMGRSITDEGRNNLITNKRIDKIQINIEQIQKEIKEIRATLIEMQGMLRGLNANNRY